MSLFRLGAVAVIAITLLGCSTWRPAPADFVRPDPEPAFALPGHDLGVRVEASISVESPQFAGRFRALIAGNTGPTPRVRIQLYPDVGGKILDLAASSDRIVGFTTDGSQKLDVNVPHPLPRSFLTFLALTLLDRHLQPVADTPLQISTDHGGELVAFRRPSAWPGHRVEEPRRLTNLRVHHYRSVSWNEQVTENRIAITAPDFSLTIEPTDVDYDSPLPESVFVLELPSDAS
ncbi:MAG: hypothetical protein AAF488_06290 [Planctomycetota bacterium]